jgi:hypothetical protein
VSSVVEEIWSDGDLRAAVRTVERRCVARDFESSAPQFEALPEQDIDYPYLLGVASALAQSDREPLQDAALRIAQSCLEDSSSSPAQKAAASYVLMRLDNTPALELAVRRERISADYLDYLPHPLRLDSIRRRLDHMIFLASGESMHANDFQREFWNSAEKFRRVSVSAPTSAGKSHVLKRWIQNVVATTESSRIAYLVPTRALIEEVSFDVRSHLAKAGFKDTPVITLPWHQLVKDDGATIFVFTQERYHVLLSKLPSFAPDLLIVDEAHKIGDGHRGILLQQVVEETENRSSTLRSIFASPLTSNPDRLLANQKGKAFASEKPTVNQNLLWLSQVYGSPRRWTLEAVDDGYRETVGEVRLDSNPDSEPKRLALTAFALGGTSNGNLVYVNGADQAEKVAVLLAGCLAEVDEAKNPDVKELANLIRDVIHPKFALRTVIRNGVGFHYGNMPLVIRSEVERLFKLGVLRYLVCTSTLLEGVNLPCRSLFVRGPQKGRARPMTPGDFWNLAGRSGRWGTEFQGNIVCIDPEAHGVWKLPPPTSRVRHEIIPSSAAMLDDPSDLYEFIQNGSPREAARKRPALDFVTNFLYAAREEHGSVGSLPWVMNAGGSVVSRLDTLLDQAGAVDVPVTVVKRHPSISPFAMQSMLRYFRAYEKDLDNLPLVPPSSEDAADHYVAVLTRINRCLGDEFGRGGMPFVLSLLITRWMRGRPLAALISGRISYYQKKFEEGGKKPPRVPATIRNTMRDVEEIARYQAPRLLSCYFDLVKLFAEETRTTFGVQQVDDIAMLLEFGVSAETQLSLMALGLSRTTAIAISEYIVDDSLSSDQCREWIESHDLESLGLARAALVELQMLSLVELHTA